MNICSDNLKPGHTAKCSSSITKLESIPIETLHVGIVEVAVGVHFGER